LSQIKDMIKPEEIVESSQTNVVKINMPEYAEPITWNTKSLLLNSYLDRRNIELSVLIHHKCSICEVGHYMHRMIIPIYYGGVLVSYQAADLTGRAKVKYDTAPGNINNYLYNYDKIDKRMILVEGILDAWRMETNVCAIFGSSLSKKQQGLILDKNLKELIFCWDGDTFWKARRVSNYFRSFIEKVIVVKLPEEEDPDSLGRDKVYDLIRETSIRN
ncbi:MAG: hypothetical protein ACTSUP_00360, partial [Candidatus Heimdallarchaeaceae archaeon]